MLVSDVFILVFRLSNPITNLVEARSRMPEDIPIRATVLFLFVFCCAKS